MSQGTTRISSIAEADLHETLTLVGFFLGYSALMGIVVSSTAPFLAGNWSSAWPLTLAAAAVAALLIVAGLFVWPKGNRQSF